MPLNDKEKSILKFLGAHLFYGVAAGVTFGGTVLMTNLSNIRTLALGSPHPAVVLALMFSGLIVTFGSVSMAVGIISLAHDEGEGKD